MSQPLPQVCNRHGARLLLGRELGRGGEGMVHELPSQPEWVAKRYHQAPDAAKQQKLRLMAEAIDSPLRNYAAWPEETLHDAAGAVIGFTMQRIEGRLPIHMLYSPAQRRESFPQARFDFLVFVARNIAAAFATLHEHGHVLGDVNQGNVLVGADSRVILIDCDSFQIQVGEALHRCEVGVAHFTPPELQSIASFEDITRTPNHDGFGLALLIFHLLMGGRHPYSGVPLADHIGESLEADIRDFRYAYAKDAAQRLIAPPPKSVPIESLPPEIVDLFEQAFTERGVDARPTATQWVAALDALRAAIRACNKNPLHLYARHLAECVWCTLERKRVLFFGQLPRSRVETSKVAVPTAPSVAMMEEAVAKWPAPRELKAPVLPELRPVSNTAAREQDVDPIVIPLSGLLTGGVIGFAGDAVLGGLLIGSSALIAGALGFRSLRIARRRGAYEEAIARYKRLNAHYADLVGEINEACGVKAHEQWRQATRALRQFVAKDAQALAEFELGTTERGLRQFLQSQRIDQWKEPRLSYLDRVRLRSAGIETAADFDKAILGKLRMLGAEGRGAVVQWKLDLIREFNRSKPRTAQLDLKTFQAERQRQRRDLEERVADVYSKLKQVRKHGSLVLTARMNQLESLKTELYRQHTLCVELGKQLG